MAQQGYLTSVDGDSFRLYVTTWPQNISLGLLNTTTAAFSPFVTASATELTVNGGIIAGSDIVTAGNMQCVTLTQTSDARTKQDIEDLSLDEAQTTLLKIRARSFRFTRTPHRRRQLGVIAQELQQILPDLVHTDAQTGLLSVNYVELQMYTLVAVQKLMLEVAELQAACAVAKS